MYRNARLWSKESGQYINCIMCPIITIRIAIALALSIHWILSFVICLLFGNLHEFFILLFSEMQTRDATSTQGVPLDLWSLWPRARSTQRMFSVQCFEVSAWRIASRLLYSMLFICYLIGYLYLSLFILYLLIEARFASDRAWYCKISNSRGLKYCW